jgi:hypothetical protein
MEMGQWDRLLGRAWSGQWDRLSGQARGGLACLAKGGGADRATLLSSRPPERGGTLARSRVIACERNLASTPAARPRIETMDTTGARLTRASVSGRCGKPVGPGGKLVVSSGFARKLSSASDLGDHQQRGKYQTDPSRTTDFIRAFFDPPFGGVELYL